ncbi:hypothetical protein BDV59DRAFT_200159 [Aspergillus ambiguus]|uniref:uncharacterized protein n=1 Tax=Aspergillus ambiguus TaxID=176160 RepID=UPI003CCCBA50
MSDTTWNDNGFNIADVQHTQEAIATIRTAIQVTSYLNDAQINGNCSNVVNNVVGIYRRYQERVLAVDGVQLNNWIERRINQLQDLWTPLAGQDPEARGGIEALNGLLNTLEVLFLDTGNMDLGF